MRIKIMNRALLVVALMAFGTAVHAQCRDAVVLVHGNTGDPSDWDNTYTELMSRGYNSSEIFRPSWGSKSCAACNNHNGWEETPVYDALNSALNASCTGKIDVIGHSMGVTLAAQQINYLGIQSNVDTFVGVAGAYRGLWSCGTYPYNVQNSTCGYWGLSVSSPFLDWLYGKPIANKVYSIKSWYDQVVCSTGYCTVGGVHSSQIAGENASYTYNQYGHFYLQAYTYTKQVDLIQ